MPYIIGGALLAGAIVAGVSAYEGAEKSSDAAKDAARIGSEAEKAKARIEQQTALRVSQMQEDAARRTYEMQRDALHQQMIQAEKINIRTEGRALIQQAAMDSMDKVGSSFDSFIKANDVNALTAKAKEYGLEDKFAAPLQQPNLWDSMTTDPFSGQSYDEGNQYTFGNDGVQGNTEANLGPQNFPNLHNSADGLRQLAQGDLANGSTGDTGHIVDEVNHLVGISSGDLKKG